MSLKRNVKGANDKPMNEREIKTKRIINPTYDDLKPLFEDVYEAIEDVVESVQPALNQLLNISTAMLFRNFEQWFIDKGLDKTDPMKQFEKLEEEVAELKEALESGDKEKIEDEASDVATVIIGMMLQNGSNFIPAMHKCYDKIKDRTGEVVDGSFVQTHKLNKESGKSDDS